VVVGIFKFVNSQNVIAYASYDQIASLLNLYRQSFSYRIVTLDHSETYQRAKGAEIDKFFRDHGYDVREVEAGLSSLDTASEGLEVLVTFLLIMAVLTATVGSMGLTGTMGMNVLERTREIGIMRSIGAVDLEIIKAVIIEGVVIGVISWFLGAILSFPISAVLARIISLAIFSTPIDLAFTAEGFGIWLLLVLILSALASVLPARSAARLTIREVLAYE
jgi:putative ABC transport system permease protein